MRGTSGTRLLRQLRLNLQRPLPPRRQQGRGSGVFRDRPWTAWLRVFLLAGCIGGVAGVAFSSCIVPDLEYCSTREQCPSVETDLGMMPLLCHPTRHVCVNAGPNTCFTDMDCIADYKNPRCDTSTNTCTSCRAGDSTDKSCGHFADRKLCVAASDGSGTLCVGCQTNRDCPMTAPICDGQLCRKCSAHSDCEGLLNCDNGAECKDSLVCIQEGDLTPDLVGRCAQNGPMATGRVVYVNGDLTKCMKTAQGTDFSTPLCELGDALTMAAAQNRHFIRAVGPNLARINQLITQGTYTFIGAPTKTTQPVYKDMAEVDVRDTFATINGTAAITFDQFDLREVTPMDRVMIRCAQTGLTVPSLTLKNSILSGGAMPSMPSALSGALVLSSCQAVIDGNIIGVRSMTELSNPAVPVHGTGINIVDTNGTDVQSSYLIQNNIIVGNAGYGINLVGAQGAASKFILRFNTIIGNGRGLTGQPGGIACPSGGGLKEFSNSIVYGNAASGGSQFQGTASCNFKNVVTGAAESGSDPGFLKLNPDLDESFRMRATSDNTACCIDKVTPVTGETLPSRDVDGTTRPQNSKWDIGASELKK